METKINVNNITLELDANTGLISLLHGNKLWEQRSDFETYVLVSSGDAKLKLPFSSAKDMGCEQFSTGVGSGFKIRYSNWEYNDDILPLSIETVVWVDFTYSYLHFELAPFNESSISISKVVWPSPFEFGKPDADAYTVLPMMQGVLIPNNWPEKVESLEPCAFYDRSGYMPWYGQIDGTEGYMQIIETPWDSGYEMEHPEGGPTRINMVWNSSLGKIGYKRSLRVEFFEDCDYNVMCKRYRKYVKEHGKLATLSQKALANSKINDLIGAPIIHSYIYSFVKPEALVYNKEYISANYKFCTFEERERQLAELGKKGVSKAYLHLDGWSVNGYDQMHPDIMPPCEKAGGAEKMRQLVETCKKLGFLFGTHDQYRDYYTDAKTYDTVNSVRGENNTIPRECTWNGGEQTYLCASLAPDYVRRNFEQLKQLDINLDGTYLDVFSVTILDECFHKEHPMTRKECMEYRGECFDYLKADGLITSSEETVDWSIPHIDLCHHSPYATAPYLGGGKARGIPVPLFNLVYHDCIVVPWALSKEMEGMPDDKSGLLYALLNGGTAYLSIDATQEEIERCRTVCDLHKQIAAQEMVKHEFVDGDLNKERTYFADGTVVEVDFNKNEYRITQAKEA